MAYLIDGHNLIAHVPDISLEDPDDEAKLVLRLNRYMMRRGKRCTVVFDQGLPGGVDAPRTNSYVQVVFAPSHTSADRVIIERIRRRRDPGYWQVVTSDREVADAARARGVKVIAAGEFASMLAAAGGPDTPDDEDPNPRMTPDDVRYWLRQFGADDAGHTQN